MIERLQGVPQGVGEKGMPRGLQAQKDTDRARSYLRRKVEPVGTRSVHRQQRLAPAIGRDLHLNQQQRQGPLVQVPRLRAAV